MLKTGHELGEIVEEHDQIVVGEECTDAYAVDREWYPVLTGYREYPDGTIEVYGWDDLGTEVQRAIRARHEVRE